MGIYGSPLISEQVAAWKYGPVVESIYHEVKNYGTNNITALISKTDFTTMESVTPRVDRETMEGATALSLIQRVWDLYSPFDGIRLSNMTHQPGSPWFKVWKPADFNSVPNANATIPTDVIREHFIELAK